MVLALSGLGMIASVGRSAAAVCAAIRAGLDAPRALSYFRTLDPDTQDSVPLLGHPIHAYTEGFAPIGRWLRLSDGCVADLVESGGAPDAADVMFWQRTGLFFVGPVLDGARFIEAQDKSAGLRDAFLDQLVDVLRLPLNRAESHFVDLGPSGLATALRIAEQRLAKPGIDRFLVVAADSYLDAMSLEWLNDHGRLKSRGNPCGLMPGEAGACALVEPEARAQQRRAPVLALFEAASNAQEADHFFTDRLSTGAGLAQAIRGVTAAIGGPFEGDVISNLNGEEWRANEWGHTLTRLGAAMGETRLVLPASSLGDVGAASSVAALAIAARSFARGYAKGNRALIVSSSEYGNVGAVLVRARTP